MLLAFDQPGIPADRLPIPRDAVSFLVGSFDPAKTYDAVIDGFLKAELGDIEKSAKDGPPKADDDDEAAKKDLKDDKAPVALDSKKMKEETAEEIKQQIEQTVREATGLRLREDILSCLGPTWGVSHARAGPGQGRPRSAHSHRRRPRRRVVRQAPRRPGEAGQHLLPQWARRRTGGRPARARSGASPRARAGLPSDLAGAAGTYAAAGVSGAQWTVNLPKPCKIKKKIAKKGVWFAVQADLDQASGQWFWATQTTADVPNEADWADTQNLFGLGCISFAKAPSGSDIGANKDMQDCLFSGDAGEKDFIMVLN